jgi:hypothetical protein
MLQAEAPDNETAAELARMVLGDESDQLREYLLPRAALQKGKLRSSADTTSAVYEGMLHKPPLFINQQARPRPAWTACLYCPHMYRSHTRSHTRRSPSRRCLLEMQLRAAPSLLFFRRVCCSSGTEIGL